eukprot:PhF_6_TR26255/c0_g1_i1/m.37548/K00889/PIP5K; 1-phosphatidylinositol-4-phosphate 5-kinase
MSDDIQNVIRSAGLPSSVECLSASWNPVQCDFSTANTIQPSKSFDFVFHIFRTHVVISANEGHHCMVVFALDDIERFQRKKEIKFVNNSFANPPKTALLLFVTLRNGAGVFTIRCNLESTVCDQVGRSLEMLIKYNSNMCTSKERQYMSCNKFCDAFSVIGKFPYTVDAVLQGGFDSKEDGVLRIEMDGRVTFFPRPLDLNSAPRKSTETNLAEVLMVSTQKSLPGFGSGGLVFALAGRMTMVFQEIQDLEKVANDISSLWLMYCNYAAHRDEDTTSLNPFSLSEMQKVLKHFQSIDLDSNGSISREEFSQSMGSLFMSSPLPSALFSLFDIKSRGSILFGEYLYGCRVLMRGNSEDRLRYLFCLFDNARKGHITLESFGQAVAMISNHVMLNAKPGESAAQLAERLFMTMDRNKDGVIDLREFEEAFNMNETVREAFSTLIEQRDTIDQVGETKGGKSIFFGYPAWNLVTNILCGIQWSCEQAKSQAMECPELPKDQALNQKLTFNCTTGEVVRQKGGNVSNIMSPRTGGGMSPKFGGQGNQGFPQSPLGNAAPSTGDVFFSDYAPHLFHNIRLKFGITPDAYLKSLGIDQLIKSLLVGRVTSLYEMSSSGRSGSFFFMSYDAKYILKTLPQAESLMLRKILPSYYDHIMNNPDTLITRFYGLHSIVIGHEKIPFVVMGNVFHQQKPIHVIFDLKGSTVNRSTPLSKRAPGVALKDLDFQRKLELPSGIRQQLVSQIQADARLLSVLNINDYSFLLGIHTNRDDQKIEPCPPDACPKPMYSTFQQFWGGIPSKNGNEVFFCWYH